MGIPLHNNLESVIMFQLYVREKPKPAESQKSLFLKPNGKPYTSGHWQLKTIKMMQLFNQMNKCDCLVVDL